MTDLAWDDYARAIERLDYHLTALEIWVDVAELRQNQLDELLSNPEQRKMDKIRSAIDSHRRRFGLVPGSPLYDIHLILEE
jgi:hypothetical protein